MLTATRGQLTLVERISRSVLLVALPPWLAGRAGPSGAGRGHGAASQAAVSFIDLGSGQGDGRARPVHRRHRGAGVLL
jgi:hypothetical protein